MDQNSTAPKIVVKLNNVLTVSDFKKICRICLQTQTDKIPISSLEIINMVVACASVQISEDDNLPHQICTTCFNDLKCAFALKKLCIKSDQILRQLLELQDKRINTIQTQDILQENVQCGVSINDNANECLENVEIKNIEKGDSTEDATEDQNEELVEDYNDDDNGSENFPDETPTIRYSLSSPPRFNTDRYKFKCDDCPCRFETVWQLGKHMKRHHFVQGISCNKCRKVFYHPLHLQEHNKKHTTERVTCDRCSKKYSNLKALETHKLVKHSGQLPFSCTECNNEKFESKFKLEKHLFSVHKKGKDPCQLTTCNICNKTMQKPAFRKHSLTHLADRPKVTCELCNKTFSSKYSLEEHINGVHKKAYKLQYACPVCDKKLLRPSSVKYHMVTHTKEKAYSCDKCLTSFSTKSALNTHITRTHLNLRKFACPICTQKFFDRASVENHIRIHTGKRPFKCTICERTFSFKSALITHNKNIHLKKNGGT